jgi:hypothetical protein
VPGANLAAELLESLPVPEPVRGGEILTVIVTTRDDRPVPGVVIEATPGDQSPLEPRRHSTDPPLTLEEELRRYAARLLRQHRTTVNGTTGSDGRAVLEGLAAVEHGVQARVPGYELAPRSRRVTPSTSVEFQATPLTLVQFDVRLPEGGQPARAGLDLRWEDTGTRDSGRHELWGPEDPAVEVPAGQAVTATATVRGDRELRSEPVEVRVPVGNTPPTVVLQLVGRSGITGQVLDLPAEGLIAVEAVLCSGSDPPPPGRRPRGRHGYERTYVPGGSDGRFELLDLPPGSYQVRIVGDHNQELAGTRVQVGGGVSQVTLRYPPPEVRPRESFAKVWVRTPVGGLAPKVRFELVFQGPRGRSGGRAPGERQEDGSFLVELPDEWPADARQSLLVVQADGYGEEAVPFQRTAATVIEVLLREPATLQVRVPGLAGSGLEHTLRVNAVVRRGTHRARAGRFELIDAETFEARAVTLGEVTVQLELPGDRRPSVPIASQTVQVQPGPNQVRLPLPVLCRVELVAEDVEPGTWVGARHRQLPGLWQRSAPFDEQHRAILEPLPQGPYLLVIRSREMAVEVRGDMTVLWQPGQQNVLAVSVRSPSGYLAEAGLEDGDLIVGVAGQRLATAAEIQAALFAIAAEEGEASLLVQRGAATLTVAVDALRFTTRQDLGGFWTPATRREP